MKKIFILLVIVFTSSFVNAQDRMDRDEKIKTLKIAFITDALNLSKTEAQKFWPVYNKFDEENHALREASYKKRKDVDVTTMSESEASKLLDDMQNSYNKRHQLFSNYMKDIRSILPAKKVIMLKQAEDNFKRKMFEEFKKRRHDKNDKP
ncbi:hypothetical protein [Corallibacter sp.]|uniref:hypothetical protein n=1 Tax=Corallibacter sp. TaxID=2038084 RepID=UPI003A93E398